VKQEAERLYDHVILFENLEYPVLNYSYRFSSLVCTFFVLIHHDTTARNILRKTESKLIIPKRPVEAGANILIMPNNILSF
jgi:hypothetical protein